MFENFELFQKHICRQAYHVPKPIVPMLESQFTKHTCNTYSARNYAYIPEMEFPSLEILFIRDSFRCWFLITQNNMYK